jgi:hypothetical protein
MLQNAENRSMLLLSDADIAGAYHVDWDRLNDRQWRESWSRGIKR